MLFYKIQPPTLEKWVILGLDQELCKMRQEHFAVRKSKAVPKIYKTPKLWLHAKGREEPMKECTMAKVGKMGTTK